jgi:cyclophilin family peptidyl-prolyl cis-trans isomerase
MTRTRTRTRTRRAGLAVLLAALLGTAAILLPGCATSGADPREGEGVYARIHTNKGLIVGRLDVDRTPMTVSNFVGLAEGTIENDAFDAGRPYYDGSVFHRVVAGHVIQTGAAAGGRAAGPGYTFPNEIHAELSHDRAGVLNMANGGPHTNAGQFTITLGDRSYLDGDYIAFGEVVEGMDVVFSIEQGDVVDSVRIVRTGAKAEGFRPTTASFQALVQEAGQRWAGLDERHRSAEREWLARELPALAGSPDSVRTIRLAPPTAARAPGQAVRVRYQGRALRFMAHRIGYSGPDIAEVPFASGPDGAPGFHDPAHAFTVGADGAPPGLDRVLASLGPGERAIVVVPPGLAYGTSGFYATEVPGQPRFVVSPNTTLVFEVEALVD